jgi:hypothetical protein
VSTQIPVDDFTRSDENPLGGNYTVVPVLATLTLSSNQVVSSIAGSCAAYNNAVSLGNDQWAQVDVTTFDTVAEATAMHPGPMLRVDTAVRTHYIGQVGGTGNNGSTLERRVGGVKTTVQTENTTVNAAPMTVYLEIIGLVYNLKINGVSTLSGTDAGGLATGARIGLFCYANSVTSAVAIDNFTGGDFVTEPALPMGAYQSVKRGAFF